MSSIQAGNGRTVSNEKTRTLGLKFHRRKYYTYRRLNQPKVDKELPGRVDHPYQTTTVGYLYSIQWSHIESDCHGMPV